MPNSVVIHFESPEDCTVISSSHAPVLGPLIAIIDDLSSLSYDEIHDLVHRMHTNTDITIPLKKPGEDSIYPAEVNMDALRERGFLVGF